VWKNSCGPELVATKNLTVSFIISAMAEASNSEFDLQHGLVKSHHKIAVNQNTSVVMS